MFPLKYAFVVKLSKIKMRIRLICRDELEKEQLYNNINILNCIA